MKNRPAVSNLVHEDEELLLPQLNRLERALLVLRFGNESGRDKNFNVVREVIEQLDKITVPHLDLEENVLFPYLAEHIPRLEEAIKVLILEHQDFRKYLQKFKLLLESCGRKEEEPAYCNTQCYAKGIYLVLLLKNHIRQESEILFEIANTVLHAEEKQVLQEKLKNASFHTPHVSKAHKSFINHA